MGGDIEGKGNGSATQKSVADYRRPPALRVATGRFNAGAYIGRPGKRHLGLSS